ncbi:hypothetical protein M422DRAFT_784115 [Sphaerobolus stellatus SS14]|uniref:Unplaced genomic scaffold SPHSTscaffold_195, whole genome shotgun sequence n=1 Tax=Sphaerobolus stellatus (strain SS14) TaxID=990650 RepID=A0A0C9TJY9_SPHS4|nr:hypothetical protein M422DRAFT_784115 [Sphaerobolus stellatus SS14]
MSSIAPYVLIPFVLPLFLRALQPWVKPMLDRIISHLGLPSSRPSRLYAKSQPDFKEQNDYLLTAREVKERFQFGQWQRQSYEAFLSVILSEDPVAFPCIYATKGFKAKEQRYVFLHSEDMHDKENIRLLAAALRTYLSNNSASRIGPNTSLVVLFPISGTPRSVKEYHDTYWECLKRLHQMDGTPWPSHIPVDMNTPLWRFCFAGEALFSLALTPAHEKRRTRYAPCFSIVFQPPFVFDILFATEQKRASALAKVRSLLGPYDQIPVSPELKNYGDVTGRECKQYFLMDDNDKMECPFTSLYEQGPAH